MGIRTNMSSNSGTIFSEDVLKIEICGPNEDYLTVIDVPGIFRNPTEGITTKEDVRLVQNMVREYIKNSRTIILAVLPSNVDIATQEILTLAEDYDKAGERTLGVLTKPDLVTERSAQVSLCNLVLGKKRPLTLGYYIVRNRGADDGDVFDHTFAEQMFRDEPWNGLPKDRLGVLSLKERLSELLGQITKKEFPKLRNEVVKQLSDCRKELEGLGPARQTEQEQRLFLSTMAGQFQKLVHAALNAHYSSNDSFEESEELRLITYVTNLTELFNRDFEQRAHLRYFDGETQEASNLSEEGGEETWDLDEEAGKKSATGTWPEASVKQKERILKGINPDEFPVLEDIVSKCYQFEDPQDGIMDWTEELFLRSRGTDLGTFSGTILSSAFKEQSSKWMGMTKAYVSNVILVIHRFLANALNMICVDLSVREEIWSYVLDEVLKRYKAAMDQAMFLVSIERDKRPYTLNHYFNENLQIARGNRMAEMLRGKARKEIKLSEYRNTGYTSDNLIVDLDSVKNATINKSNVEHVKEEIHDILRSYYKVARKRFVDNVYQAVDHFLLTGPSSPLAVFNQEWVISLETDQLEAIAGESPITKQRRAVLLKKIQDLEDASRILKH